jgi:hypothetical protein
VRINMPRNKKSRGGTKEQHRRAGRLGGLAKARKNQDGSSSGGQLSESNPSTGGDVTSSGSSYMGNSGTNDQEW